MIKLSENENLGPRVPFSQLCASQADDGLLNPCQATVSTAMILAASWTSNAYNFIQLGRSALTGDGAQDTLSSRWGERSYSLDHASH